MPPDSCYVIARPDAILVTHDGGATWGSHVLPVPGRRELDRPGVPGGNSPDIRGRPALCRLGLLDIGCVSARICYAVATAPPGYEQPAHRPVRHGALDHHPAEQSDQADTLRRWRHVRLAESAGRVTAA